MTQKKMDKWCILANFLIGNQNYSYNCMQYNSNKIKCSFFLKQHKQNNCSLSQNPDIICPLSKYINDTYTIFKPFEHENELHNLTILRKYAYYLLGKPYEEFRC